MGEFFETFQMLTSPKKSNRFYNKEKSAAKAAVFHKFKNSLTCILWNVIKSHEKFCQKIGFLPPFLMAKKCKFLKWKRKLK